MTRSVEMSGADEIDKNKACALRAKAYGQKNFKPAGDTASLLPGTYYLESIDDEFKRTYVVKQ
jgi:hydroxymethylglutaryl-CoA synthase